MTKTKNQLVHESRLESQMRATKVALRDKERQYQAVADENVRLERALEGALALKNHKPHLFAIKPSKNAGGEATAVACLSDVHWGELVPAHKVNNLNQYSPAIAKQRVSRFHELVTRFIADDRRSTRIGNLVLWWGGDIITNEMHDTPNALGVAPEVLEAMDGLHSGLHYLLESNTNLNIHVVGSVGNHGRAFTQKPVNQAREQEQSWEWAMYNILRDRYKHEKRVTWTMDRAYHTYIQVYDKTVRFNHGHLGWRYNLGLGGVHGPLWKVISQTWDKQRRADLTVCGHYHTLTPASIGRPYMVNGSVIGVTPYGMNFGFEPPAQIYFLIHSRYGVVNQRALFLE